jgi:hypothetical protein
MTTFVGETALAVLSHNHSMETQPADDPTREWIMGASNPLRRPTVSGQPLLFTHERIMLAGVPLFVVQDLTTVDA